MTTFDLDKLDINLLKACQEKDGKSLAEILEPFLGHKSERALYYRFDRLEEMGLIEIDRVSEKGRSLCHATDKILAGQGGSPSPSGDERLGK